MLSQVSRRAVLALILASFVFGATFVVVKSALDDIGPLSFVAWRFLIGAVILGAFVLPRGRSLWLQGSITGLALFTGYALQTAGLEATTASNSALITGFYVVLTPLLSSLIRKRPPSAWLIAAALAAFVGIYLLTGAEGARFGRGDLLTMGCALAFSLYILALARFAGSHPVVPFTTVQLATTAVLAFVASAVFETPGLPPNTVWAALLITGVGVGIGAYLLQVWAQTILGPSTAAVILAAEPAFGVATAWVVLDERLDMAGWVGTLLIVAAIFVVVTRQEDEASIMAEAVAPAH